MKKILLIITLLFLFMPHYYAASGTTNYDYIDITVNNDGSMTVREYYGLAGKYNGSYRDLNYIGSTIPFNGDKESFKGSDIYNGSSITDIKVYDTHNQNGTIALNKQFTLNQYADTGDYGVYQLSSDLRGVSVKIFNPSSKGTDFYIEYTITDVVIIHNDVAEIGWNFFGPTYEENTKNLEINFYLPANNNYLRGWAHGPLDGEIKLVNKSNAQVTYKYLSSNTPIDVRLVFDKEAVPNATKKSNVDALNTIFEIEEEWANKSNVAREKARFFVNTTNVLTYLWYIGLLIIVIKVYKNYDQEYKAIFNQQYFRDFPTDYGPEIVNYLFNKKITANGLSASILELIRKKHLNVEVLKGKDYKLIKNTDYGDNLTDAEIYLKNWFLNEIGNGEWVSSNNIKKETSYYEGAQHFLKKYEMWKNIVSDTANKEEFFEDHFNIKLKVLLYTILGSILIFTLNIVCLTNNILGYIIFLPAMIATIYFATYIKRTVKGNEQYQKWRAFKRFLKDFGRFSDKELPEVYLWEKYLVYATALGVATKLAKVMRIRLENMEVAPNIRTDYTFLYLNNRVINHSISSTISHSINRRVSGAIAGSRRSSGSGHGGGTSFGGGFGGGGGSFGGGGGGGRF